MSIFRKKVREFVPNTAGSDRESGFHYRLAPEGIFQQELYDALRANVPVIDACFGKIIRLTGGFKVTACDDRATVLIGTVQTTAVPKAAEKVLDLAEH